MAQNFPSTPRIPVFAVIGSTSVDIIIQSPNRMPRFDGDEFTSASLVFTDDPPTFSPGGNGCNCTYVLAGLGARSVLCSAVGTDALGEMMVGWLEEAGVELAALKEVPDAATSSTTIITTGERRLSFHHPGALRTYRPGDLPDRLPSAADVLLVCSYPLLPDWRPDGYAHVLREARRSGVVTALDVGPAVGDPVTVAELVRLLEHVDYFICNSLELERCTGDADLKDGMRRVAASGVACVVTKLGRDGAAVLGAGRSEPEFVPGFAVDAHGTVGAGDSFNAGFLYALRDGAPLMEAVRFGNALASIVIASPLGVRVRATADDVRRVVRT